MIKSFRHKGLENFFKTGSLKGIQAKHQDKLSTLLFLLDTAKSIVVFDSPVFRLHKLKGNMQNLWSLTVQENWRITFEYDEKTSDVFIVDYQDYH